VSTAALIILPLTKQVLFYHKYASRGKGATGRGR